MDALFTLANVGQSLMQAWQSDSSPGFTLDELISPALGRLAADPFLRVALGDAAHALVRERDTASARRRHLRAIAARLPCRPPPA